MQCSSRNSNNRANIAASGIYGIGSEEEQPLDHFLLEIDEEGLIHKQKSEKLSQTEKQLVNPCEEIQVRALARSNKTKTVSSTTEKKRIREIDGEF